MLISNPKISFKNKPLIPLSGGIINLEEETLTYLAKILVEAYFEQKKYDRTKKQPKQ
jgi:hypothetical protein